MSIGVIDMQESDCGPAFAETIRDTGFAVLRNPPIPAERLRRMWQDWLGFFLSEEKWDYPATETASGNTSGYIPADVSETAVGHGVKDLKEFFHVNPSTRLPPALASDVWAHLDDAFRLAQQLLGWIDEYCGMHLPASLKGRLAESLSREISLFRLLHYPPLKGGEPEGAVRAAAHEDINLITLLPVSEQMGLQILTRDKRWLDVPGSPGDIVVNAGDMLQEATQRFLPSTTHRVVNPSGSIENTSRMAMPYFLAPELDTRLSERYTAGSYLAERLELLAR